MLPVGLGTCTTLPHSWRRQSFVVQTMDVNEARSIRDGGRGHKVVAKAECYEAEAKAKVD